ncbi:MAG: trypsin-like peptidase domain-containing protein, partial [Pseudomonadales bacterium]|nr:trypsin-like peptidase domain-containing protein [Pseudomonadales bacterium]
MHRKNMSLFFKSRLTRLARALKVGLKKLSPAIWRSLLCRLGYTGLSMGVMFSSNAAGETIAQSLFEALQQQVFQVRVIDLGSGDKYSIGSGFQISEDGLIATNYHVISAFVIEPEKYSLEIVAANGDKQQVSLSAIDVIHDLAILKAAALDKNYIRLSRSIGGKGSRIYSIGNPLDLGMTIIEGNYNGLVKRSRYQKILFSGSLNSGMSGGPAVSESGNVVGINVSKGGEQISFLVPVVHLRALLNKTRAAEITPDFHEQVRKDLLADQQMFADALLASPFEEKQLGELVIPVNLHPALRCWGHSEGKEEEKYSAVHQHCRSDDNIFVAGDLIVGSFQYDAEWISTESLKPVQFYKLLQTRYVPGTLAGSQQEKHVTQYQCNTDFVELKGLTWKATSCYRAYKKFKGLFDAILLMALVERNEKSAIIKVAASGFSRTTS